MIKIRLSRVGKKNRPFYRIVAIESFKKREGKTAAILGFYDPVKHNVQIDNDEVKKWLEKGAVINESVKKLLK
jgi:small subunit ribosomal protein S16